MKTTLVIPDLQMPYHDSLALKKIIQVADTVKPDQVVQVGDLIDFPQVSQWSKARSGEFTDDLQEHIDQVQDEFLSPLRRAAPDAKILWKSGNHDKRIHDYVSKYGYPLKSLRALTMENLFELEKFDVEYVTDVRIISTHTKLLHGHESGGYAANISAWGRKYRDRHGSQFNYVFGHTHQPGLESWAFGENGHVKNRWIMNAGSIMNPEHATYVADGSVNWTMSFGFLRDDGKATHPDMIFMSNRKFYFEGSRY